MFQHVPRCFSSSHGSSRSNMYCLMPCKRSPTGWHSCVVDDMGDNQWGEEMDIVLVVLPKEDDGGRTSDACSRSRVHQS